MGADGVERKGASFLHFDTTNNSLKKIHGINTVLTILK